MDHIRIKADMPGVPKENVEVHIEDDVLEIKAHLDDAIEETKGNFIRRERRTSSFQRSFMLPDTVDKDAIKANMKDGVLNITIPKMEPKQPKKVPIDVD
jgi:HSP20 family protein